MPASIAVVVVTLLIGSVLFLPEERERLALSALSQQFMLANVYFWKSTGYFSGPAELEPLLHFWSLAVEEQFYLFYPLILLLFGAHRRVLTIALIGSIGISLAVSEWGAREHPTASFYLLPTRAWELLLGGLICQLPLLMGASTRIRIIREVLCMAGWGAILIPAFQYTSSTTFPGFSAAVPCLGAGLLIYSNSGDVTWSGKILQSKVVVAIGLVSYSLYLWHWPVLVFAKYVCGPDHLNWLMRLGLLCISGVAAYVSWKYVEIPFRNSRTASKSVQAHRIIALGALLTVLTGATLYSWPPAQLPDEIRSAYENAKWTGEEFVSSQAQWAGLPTLGLQTVGAKPTVLVWGDSHALAVAEIIDQEAKRAEVGVAIAARSGTIPIPDVSSGQSRRRRIDAVSWNRDVMQLASAKGIEDVILIARWSVYLEGYSDEELRVTAGLSSDGILIRDAESATTGRSEAASVMKRNFMRMLEELSRNGKRVWVVLQVPEATQSVATSLLRHHRFGIPLNLPLVTTESHEHRQASVTKIFDDLMALPNYGSSLVVIDPSPILFGAGNKLNVLDRGISLYRDEDHLSRYGAKYVMQQVFRDIFHALAQKQTSIGE